MGLGRVPGRGRHPAGSPAAWNLRLPARAARRAWWASAPTASPRPSAARPATACCATTPTACTASSQNIGAQQGIDRIRIFNKEGRDPHLHRSRTRWARSSTSAPSECIACHQRDQPQDAPRPGATASACFRAPDGQRILGIIAPIHNEPQCATACHVHPAAQRVLGVLDVQLSMASVDAGPPRAPSARCSTASSRPWSPCCCWPASWLWRMVLRPVERLTAAMARVGAGDLETRVPVTLHGRDRASWPRPGTR